MLIQQKEADFTGRALKGACLALGYESGKLYSKKYIERRKCPKAKHFRMGIIHYETRNRHLRAIFMIFHISPHKYLNADS